MTLHYILPAGFEIFLIVVVLDLLIEVQLLQ